MLCLATLLTAVLGSVVKRNQNKESTIHTVAETA